MSEASKTAGNSILAANTLIYLATSLLNKAIPFLALPILTIYLTPADYGVLANALVLVELLVIFIGLNSQAWLRVHFFRLEQTILFGAMRFTLRQFVALTFAFTLVMVLAWLIASNIPREYLWIPLMAGMQVVPLLLLTLWQCEHNARTYAQLSLLITATNFGLSILFIVAFDMAWQGRLLGILIANLLGTFITMAVFVRRGVWRAPVANRKMRLDQLRYGANLLPTAIAWWSRTGIDRFILSALVGLPAVGLYTAALQIALIVLVVGESLNQALAPSLYDRLKKREGSQRFLVRLCLITGAILVGAYGAILLFLPLLYLLLGEHFHAAIPLVKVLALAYIFHGITLITNNVLYYFGRVRLLSYVTVAGSLIHIALAWILTKQQGLDGIVIALPISATIMLLLSITAVAWTWRNSHGEA